MDRDYPIGARILSPTMMRCSFQHTEAVLETIEDMRKVARRAEESFCELLRKHPDRALMEARGYNNAISILGSRGSGKTSIIMTLHHILKSGMHAWESGERTLSHADKDVIRPNIIMPILVPQDFSESQSLLSWIVVKLLDKAEEIEQGIAFNSSSFYCAGSPFSRWLPEKTTQPAYDPLRECMDSLTSAFELRYKSNLKVQLSEIDHVYRYMDEVRRDSRLVLDMLRLISMMVDYYRYQFSVYNQGKTGSIQEPLFFFVIDDLDMAPERSQEVLNLVLRYLQHPNVVVLCGWNQELFQNHLCTELLKNQGVLSTDLLNTNLGYDDVFMTRQRKRVATLDSARRLAMDNLKKAFPPAQRYEIRGLSTRQRAFFPHIPGKEFGADQTQPFFWLIESTLKECKNNPQEQVEFLYDYRGDPLMIYMRIFDNKARGMINVYKAFEGLKMRLQKWDRNNSLDITPYIRSLLDTILFSNTHFTPYRRGLRDLVSIDEIIVAPNTREKASCKYYCSYRSVESVLRDYNFSVGKLELNESEPHFELVHRLEREYNYFPSLILDAFLLLNFMENLIRYICGMPMFEHGGLAFSNALNEINLPIQINKETRDLLSCVIAVSGLEEIPLFPKTNDFRINLCLLNFYELNGFRDQDYDFTGSYSYCRLYDTFFCLVSEKISNENAPYRLSNDRWEKMKQSVPEWMHTMDMLFEALYYSDANIRRLTRYRCLKRQELFRYQSELFRAANEPIELDPCDKALYDALETAINDGVLEKIVLCLRWIEQFWNEFNVYYRVLQRGEEKSSQVEVYRHAKKYNELFGINSTDGDNEVDWIDINKYHEKLRDFRNSNGETDFKEPVELDTRKKIIETACQNVKGNMERLLQELKKRMQAAILINYARIQTPTKKFEYLLDASDMLCQYRKRWNLGYGGWSGREIDAVEDTIDLFKKYGLIDLQNLAQELARLGPTLDQRARDRYNDALEAIQNRVSGERSRFSGYEWTLLRQSLRTLKRAVESIQRLTFVDGQIRDLLIELGRTIAEWCAEVSMDDELRQDKSSSEQNTIAWPIIAKNRVKFDGWHEWKEQVRKEQENMSKTGTLFDLL